MVTRISHWLALSSLPRQAQRPITRRWAARSRADIDYALNFTLIICKTIRTELLMRVTWVQCKNYRKPYHTIITFPKSNQVRFLSYWLFYWETLESTFIGVFREHSFSVHFSMRSTTFKRKKITFLKFNQVPFLSDKISERGSLVFPLLLPYNIATQNLRTSDFIKFLSSHIKPLR